MPNRQFDSAANGGEGNFELHNDAARSANRGLGRVDMPGQQFVIRAARDSNEILAASIHQDERHAARAGLTPHNVAGVDSLASQASQRRVAKAVLTYVGNESHSRARPRRGHSLVCAFAPGDDLKLLTGDRFAGMRQFWDANHQVGVRAADDDDARFQGSARERNDECRMSNDERMPKVEGQKQNRSVREPFRI